MKQLAIIFSLLFSLNTFSSVSYNQFYDLYDQLDYYTPTGFRNNKDNYSNTVNDIDVCIIQLKSSQELYYWTSKQEVTIYLGKGGYRTEVQDSGYGYYGLAIYFDTNKVTYTKYEEGDVDTKQRAHYILWYNSSSSAKMAKRTLRELENLCK